MKVELVENDDDQRCQRDDRTSVDLRAEQRVHRLPFNIAGIEPRAKRFRRRIGWRAPREREAPEPPRGGQVLAIRPDLRV